MVRVVLATAWMLGACGMSEDDRPATLEYVTAAVLAPSCGNAQCHSSFRRAEDLAFDTVEATRATIARYDALVTPGDPETSSLYLVLISPGGDDAVFPRMPYDQPMPDADIELVRRWIEGGARGLDAAAGAP